MNPQPHSPSLPIRTLVAILAVVVGNVLMALTLGDTLVQPTFFPELAAENPNPALLFGGLALMGLLLALLFPSLRIANGPKWLASAAGVAIPLGLTISFATNVFQAGFINVSPIGWILEGLYDSLGPILAVLALTWLANSTYKK